MSLGGALAAVPMGAPRTEGRLAELVGAVSRHGEMGGGYRNPTVDDTDGGRISTRDSVLTCPHLHGYHAAYGSVVSEGQDDQHEFMGGRFARLHLPRPGRRLPHCYLGQAPHGGILSYHTHKVYTSKILVDPGACTF